MLVEKLPQLSRNVLWSPGKQESTDNRFRLAEALNGRFENVPVNKVGLRPVLPPDAYCSLRIKGTLTTADQPAKPAKQDSGGGSLAVQRSIKR